MTGGKPVVERVHLPLALMRVINPLARRLIVRGVAGKQLLVLHYTGRRTGRHYDMPARYHIVDGVPLVLTSAGWRHNFAGGREVEVTLRGKRLRARAVLEYDANAIAVLYERLIGQFGLKRAQRRFAFRINVQRQPTRGELREMVERSGLAIVQIELLSGL
jgi:hypothetical protein